MSIITAQVQTINGARWLAQHAIDQAAGEARMRFITSVPGQEAVYLEKRAEALAYTAAYASNQATAVAGPHIAAEAAALGKDAITLANEVLANASNWLSLYSPAIEAARIGGKAAVAAAMGADDEQTRAAIAAARDAAVATLRSLFT